MADISENSPLERDANITALTYEQLRHAQLAATALELLLGSFNGRPDGPGEGKDSSAQVTVELSD